MILGLDGAGKTTILYRLQVGEVVTTIPSLCCSRCSTASFYLLSDRVLLAAIGFNVETVQYKNLKFQVWDLGGQTSIRPYWRCYYSNTDAIIYVVDSMDRDRIGISKQELVSMLEVDETIFHFSIILWSISLFKVFIAVNLYSTFIFTCSDELLVKKKIQSFLHFVSNKYSFIFHMNKNFCAFKGG